MAALGRTWGRPRTLRVDRAPRCKARDLGNAGSRAVLTHGLRLDIWTLAVAMCGQATS
jgi:hypothetical protein